MNKKIIAGLVLASGLSFGSPVQAFNLSYAGNSTTQVCLVSGALSAGAMAYAHCKINAITQQIKKERSWDSASAEERVVIGKEIAAKVENWRLLRVAGSAGCAFSTLLGLSAIHFAESNDIQASGKAIAHRARLFANVALTITSEKSGTVKEMQTQLTALNRNLVFEPVSLVERERQYLLGGVAQRAWRTEHMAVATVVKKIAELRATYAHVRSALGVRPGDSTTMTASASGAIVAQQPVAAQVAAMENIEQALSELERKAADQLADCDAVVVRHCKAPEVATLEGACKKWDTDCAKLQSLITDYAVAVATVPPVAGDPEGAMPVAQLSPAEVSIVTKIAQLVFDLDHTTVQCKPPYGDERSKDEKEEIARRVAWAITGKRAQLEALDKQYKELRDARVRSAIDARSTARVRDTSSRLGALERDTMQLQHRTILKLQEAVRSLRVQLALAERLNRLRR